MLDGWHFNQIEEEGILANYVSEGLNKVKLI